MLKEKIGDRTAALTKTIEELELIQREIIEKTNNCKSRTRRLINKKMQSMRCPCKWNN